MAQGYLARARKMIDSYRRTGNREMARALECEWDDAAAGTRRQASIELLQALLSRVKRNRSITG